MGSSNNERKKERLIDTPWPITQTNQHCAHFDPRNSVQFIGPFYKFDSQNAHPRQYKINRISVEIWIQIYFLLQVASAGDDAILPLIMHEIKMRVLQHGGAL